MVRPEARYDQPMDAQPWGHKVTFVAYVPGDIKAAEQVVMDTDFSDSCDMVGVLEIEPVWAAPRDQIAT